jgi:hypothetical protein
VLANFSAKAQVLIEKGQDHANAITNVGKAFQELAHYEQVRVGLAWESIVSRML